MYFSTLGYQNDACVHIAATYDDNCCLRVLRWTTAHEGYVTPALLNSVLFVNKVMTLLKCDNRFEKGNGVNGDEHTCDTLLQTRFKIKKKEFLAPRYYGLSLLRTTKRGPEGVRYSGSWLYKDGCTKACCYLVVWKFVVCCFWLSPGFTLGFYFTYFNNMLMSHLRKKIVTFWLVVCLKTSD